MNIHAETPRLWLREFTVDDVDALYELDNDPAVMRYVGRPSSREEILTETLPAFLRYYATYPGYGFWAAIDKATGDFLGWFHFRPRPGDPVDEPELGYRLVQRAWGRGYATEGSRCLIDLGFRQFGARRVVAETMVVNTASRRVMEKAGLRQIRTFHQQWPDKLEGDEHGDVQYAITREEWWADQAQPPAP